ncbi:DNA sulfur modification protein DndB (plasmid) [Aeromonas media]|nr:DNA sulfur modification protein DndB [Aeromonas media]
MAALEKDICPDDRNAITISFPAVRGIQAGKEFFAAQVPFIQLEKMFVFDDEVLPAELRMQRELNTRRAVGISDYIVQNQRDYVLPALTSSVSARMWFDALPGNHGQRLGMLNIPLDAVMLINDGQHRRAGIEMAIRRVPTLKSEMVTVVFFYDEGLKRSQQIFSDINCKQVKPSSALSALFDHRDLMNIWLKEVIQGVPGLTGKIEKETASVGAKSSRLWSVVSFKKFLGAMCGVNDGNAEQILADAKQRKASIAFFIRFFNALAEHVPGWAPMMGGLLPAAEVREDMVIGHAVFLEALAIACRPLLLDERGQPAWETCDLAPLAKLASINPNKDAPSWKYRAVTINGTMNKTAFGVMATASILRGVMELTLSPDMIKADALVNASYSQPAA